MTKRVIGGIALGILILTTSCAFGQYSSSQSSGKHGHGGKKVGKEAGVSKRLNHISSKVNLTDTQKATVKSILEAQSTQMHILKHSPAVSQASKKSLNDSVRQNAHQQIQSVLNADQQNKFAVRSTGADKQLTKLSGILQLTPVQKARIRSLLNSQSAAIHSANATNTSMSKSDRKTSSRSTRADTFAKIRVLLTPAQQTTLDQHRQANQAAHSQTASISHP